MKIRLIGEDKRVLKTINSLDGKYELEIIPESKAEEYDIIKTPALIIENVVVSDIDLLSTNDLKQVFESLG